MSDALPRLALSIRQPWGWAIIHAGKDIENRNWPTKFRGPVCIHASKAVDALAMEDVASSIHPATGAGLFVSLQNAKLLQQRGGIVGVAEIVDCVHEHPSPWFFGRYGFVLANVRPVDFVPVKGALGFFDWRKNMEAGR